MNPFKVHDGKEALMALGIGLGAGVIIAILMYFLGSTISTVQKTVAGS